MCPPRNRRCALLQRWNEVPLLIQIDQETGGACQLGSPVLKVLFL